MGIFYILSLIALVLGFLFYKKSDEKLNLIKWTILAIVSIYAYNITLGMILGLLNITAHIWLLAIINLIFGIILGAKAVIKKDFQKYKVTKYDFVGLLILLVMFSVMFFKDLYIHKGNIAHQAVDTAVHYRAAKHYSDNLKLFINVEDKTFFNFNIMQTGAYINDGIFMNVIHSITGLEYAFIYQIFETLTLFLCGLSLYAFFVEKIKNKRSLITSLVLLGLYIYGFPYNSWIYGFSYLSVGIVMATLLLSVVESVYSSEKIKKRITIPLVVMTAIGLIFSYCLFVPAIFASVCIFCFLKDLSNKESKKYLKFFGKTTLIITGLLLIVTAAGIGYLFIPSFYVEGQTDLISALKIKGEIYEGKIENLIVFIPFAVLYFAEIIKRIKNRSLRYQDVFSVIMVAYSAVLYLGMLKEYVSVYYLMKTFYILWIAIFAATIDLVNTYSKEKLFRIDAIIIFAIYVLWVLKGLVFSETKVVDMILLAKIFLILLLAIFTVLPEYVKYLDLSKFKKLPEKYRKKFEIKSIKISCGTYIIIWAIFVCCWTGLKSSNLLDFNVRNSLPNFVGIYFEENCDRRNRVELNNSFNSNELDVCLYAKENFKDMDFENTQLMTNGSYFERIWATAVLEISSNELPYQIVVQDTHIYNLEETLENEDKKYIIKISSDELVRMTEYKACLEKAKENEQIEILFENENGFVAKIERKN